MSRASQSDLGDKFVSLRDGGAAPGPQQIALVPGAEVPVITLELPSGLRGQSREQVARRQLLDRAGLDGDTIQMRPIQLPRQRDSWSRVMVTDGAQLDGWKSIAGTSCRALLPDYLALPTAPDLWTIHCAGKDVLARLGPEDGFSAPEGVAENLLRLHLEAESARPKAILLQGAASAEVTSLLESSGIPVISKAADAKALGLTIPKILSHGELTFDLRRDPQLARSRLRTRVLPWRWPVLFGLLAVALWAATEFTQMRQLQARTDAISAGTRDLVRSHFVPNGPLLDMRVQVSQALAQRRTAATDWRSEVTALDLFATASGILNTAGARTETVSAVSEQELALTLKVADFAAVDQLAETLRAAGLRVNVVESRVSEGSSDVRTEMRLTPPVDGGSSND